MFYTFLNISVADAKLPLTRRSDNLGGTDQIAQLEHRGLQHRRDLRKIGEKMTGASGAETKAVCTEAGMFALRERRIHVTQEDF